MTTGSDAVLTAPLGGPLTPIAYGDFDPKLSPDGSWGIWIRHLAANEWHIIKATIPADPETDLSSAGAIDALPNWSSNQLKIIFSSGLTNSIVTMNPDGSGRTSVALATNRFYSQPDFYPGSGSSSTAKIVSSAGWLQTQ
jgi:Tol biopolymer transport system component